VEGREEMKVWDKSGEREAERDCGTVSVSWDDGFPRTVAEEDAAVGTNRGLDFSR